MSKTHNACVICARHELIATFTTVTCFTKENRNLSLLPHKKVMTHSAIRCLDGIHSRSRLCAITCHIFGLLILWAPIGSAQDVKSDTERLLTDPRAWAVVVHPVELFTYATINAPQLSAEVWVDCANGFAVNIQPRAIWYPPTKERATHGAGIGGAIGFHWFPYRSLSGPFYGIYAGNVEAFLSTGRGRIFGGTATFGYAIGFDNGGILSVSLDLGYWHRTGSLDTGTQWPEILTFRIGTGLSGGVGSWWGG